MFRRTFALCTLLLSAVLLFSQSGAEPVPASPADAMSELERKTLSLDIAISNYYELRAMAGRYGLSTEGDSEALRSRLYGHLGLEPPANPSPASSVTIERASSVEYFTLEGYDDSFMKLSGPITMTIRTEDGFVHKVKADEISFNRDKNIVQATGDVTYRREGEGRNDEFRGSSILIDLDSYSGVFLDGVYNLDPSETVRRSLSFHFEKLTRRDVDLTILDKALVTACDEVQPHYHIRARKVWLFENGDWALSGATLYLGVVPVLWLPFFYYPSDEIIFHPIFGYRSREGVFVQTTTYLLGEKPKDDKTSSSLSLFSQGKEGEGEREISGIFIRRLQRPSEDSVKSGEDLPGKGSTLKLLADIYSALGLYVGLEGSLPETKTSSLGYSLGFGLSRSLFLEANGFYSPFDYANDYKSDWNASNFLGFDMPFRFGLHAKYAFKRTTGPLRLSVAFEIPLYSDPYFEQDFYQRTESSTIISALGTNNTVVSKRTTMTQSILSSLSWTPPGAKAPSLLENASIGKLAAQMSWKSKSQPSTGLTASQKRLLAVDPQRDFFYPDNLKPLDGSFSLSGTLFHYDSKAKTAPAAIPAGSPAEVAAEAPAEMLAEAPADAKVEEKIPEKIDARNAGRDYSSLAARLVWSASGSAGIEEKFRSSLWVYPEDVDGSLSYLLAGWKGNAKLATTADWAEKLLSFQTSLGFSSQDQWRPYLYDERTLPATVHPYRLSDYAYRSSMLETGAGLTASPFRSGSPWAASSLRYSIGGTLFKYAYEGQEGSGVDSTPIYRSTWIGWDSDTLNTHSIAASLSLAPRNKASQRLNFSAYLPPLLERYSAGYSFDQKYFKASLVGAISRASASAELLPSSLSAQLTIGSAPYPVLKSDFSWDFDEAAPLSSQTTLSYGWAKASFVAKKSKGYDFSEGIWSTDGTESFRPYEATLSLTPKIGDPKDKAADGDRSARFAFRPTLSYSQNLVRFTESTLGATLDLSFTSGKGTSLSFSSVSANKSAWRYWPSFFPASASFDPGDYYKGFLGDLIDSFSIWDSTKLKSSLFKLQSLNIKLSQDLHDWDMEAVLGMSPVLVTPDSGRPYYQLDFSFSLGVAWKDIPELKSSVTYEEGSFTQ